MFGKRIKYYRLKNKMTIAELAKRIGCTGAAISQYENNLRKPDMLTLQKISDIFGITPFDLLPNPIELEFNHCGFRTNKKTSDVNKNVFLLEIEDRCFRYLEIMDILDLKKERRFEPVKLNFDDNEENIVSTIREKLGVTIEGPIFSVVEALEKLGIIVISFDAGENIEGCNGIVNGNYYIFFNKNRTVERQRFTMIHEFVHLFFNHLKNMDEKELEQKIDKIAGMVLIPNQNIHDEFGFAQSHFSKFFMELVAEEYVVAPSCLVRRLKDLGLINNLYYRNFYKFLSMKYGSRKNEETLFPTVSEKPLYFKRMVYRALGSELISVSKASELLKEPLVDVMNKSCCY